MLEAEKTKAHCQKRREEAEAEIARLDAILAGRRPRKSKKKSARRARAAKQRAARARAEEEEKLMAEARERSGLADRMRADEAKKG